MKRSIRILTVVYGILYLTMLVTIVPYLTINNGMTGLCIAVIISIFNALPLILLVSLSAILSKLNNLEQMLIDKNIIDKNVLDKSDNTKTTANVQQEGSEHIVKCENCGYQLFDDDKACSNCGHKRKQ